MHAGGGLRQVRGAVRLAGQLVASGRARWALVNVWGFADAPVAWAGLQHGDDRDGTGGGGGSHYGLLLLGHQDYCLFKPLAASEMAGPREQ